MSDIDVYSPIAESRVATCALASRLAGTGPVKLALLDNLKANAGVLLADIADALGNRDADIEVTRFDKEATAAAPDVVMAHLKTCDAVVLAIAD